MRLRASGPQRALLSWRRFAHLSCGSAASGRSADIIVGVAPPRPRFLFNLVATTSIFIVRLRGFAPLRAFSIVVDQHIYRAVAALRASKRILFVATSMMEFFFNFVRPGISRAAAGLRPSRRMISLRVDDQHHSA